MRFDCFRPYAAQPDHAKAVSGPTTSKHCSKRLVPTERLCDKVSELPHFRLIAVQIHIPDRRTIDHRE